MVSHIGITKLIIYTMIQNIKNLKSYQIKNIHLVYYCLKMKQWKIVKEKQKAIT